MRLRKNHVPWFLQLLLIVMFIISGCIGGRNSQQSEAELFVKNALNFISGKTPDFSEDFSSNLNDWDVSEHFFIENRECGKLSIVDGEYSIKAYSNCFPDYTFCHGTTNNLPQLADFILEMDVRFANISSIKDTCELGFDFCVVNGDKYQIQLKPSGELAIMNWPNHFFVGVVSCINQGNASNHLQIIVKGSKIAARINNQIAAIVTMYLIL